MKGFDLVTRKVLEALVQDPRADPVTLAGAVGATPEVVATRIQRLKDQGILQGYRIDLDAEKLGFAYEVLVTAVPSSATDRAALERLRDGPGVTRLFTLAAGRSVAFTLCGLGLASVQEEASALAREAGLRDVEVTLILDTLHDDRNRAFRDAWRTITQGPPG